ncbi:MAG: DsbA family protein [Alphaproteobacteria bacterium]|nr:DsbA family protein [Alphaproteobacteria bacterium]
MSVDPKIYILSGVIAAVVSAATHFGLQYQGQMAGTGAVTSVAQVRAIAQQVIDEEPKRIVDSVDHYVATKRAEAQHGTEIKNVDLKDDGKSPVAGNPQGDVTIVDFFDYSCCYCKRVLHDKFQVLSEDKNVKIIFKDFPILGQPSLEASKASLAVFALAPTKYTEFHQKLMENNAPRTQELFEYIAKEVGVDPAALKAKMQEPAIVEALNRNLEFGRQLGVHGTPAFVINGKLIPGAIDHATMVDLIKQARAKK